MQKNPLCNYAVYSVDTHENVQKNFLVPLGRKKRLKNSERNMCMTSEDCLNTMLWRFISENNVNTTLCWEIV